MSLVLDEKRLVFDNLRNKTNKIYTVSFTVKIILSLSSYAAIWMDNTYYNTFMLCKGKEASSL